MSGSPLLIYALSAYAGQGIVLGHWRYGSIGLAPMDNIVREIGCQKHRIHNRREPILNLGVSCRSEFLRLTLLIFWTREFFVVGICPVHHWDVQQHLWLPTPRCQEYLLALSCDNQKYLQTLPNVPRVATLPLVRKH